jgi:hypothetical protein
MDDAPERFRVVTSGPIDKFGCDAHFDTIRREDIVTIVSDRQLHVAVGGFGAIGRRRMRERVTLKR